MSRAEDTGQQRTCSLDEPLDTQWALRPWRGRSHLVNRGQRVTRSLSSSDTWTTHQPLLVPCTRPLPSPVTLAGDRLLPDIHWGLWSVLGGGGRCSHSQHQASCGRGGTRWAQCRRRASRNHTAITFSLLLLDECLSEAKLEGAEVATGVLRVQALTINTPCPLHRKPD